MHYIYNINKPLKKLNMNNKEEWRPVKGYENYYEVSNLGNVRSCDRKIIKKNGIFYNRKGQLLKSHPNVRNGQLQVMLFLHCKYKLCYVHQLVATAFIPNPNNFKNVRHIDGDKLNCRADNLKWLEPSNYYYKKFFAEKIREKNQ